jgi:prepilin-type N-terminal cleavage/methylation domain-containing protein
MAHASPADSTSGFTLTEVAIAMLLVAVALTGTMRLVSVSVRAAAAARVQTSTTALAHEKAEAIRALTWTVGEAGDRLSDSVTDLSPPTPGTGGSGLSPSPAGSLEGDVPGYVDYLDAAGGWVGRGPAMPPGAVFVRRWSVRPLPEDSLDTLVAQVLVTTRAHAALGAAAAARRLPGDARLVLVLTRKRR